MWRSSKKFRAGSDRRGTCEYCQKTRCLRPEPFGGKPACEECWNSIVFGEPYTTPPKVTAPDIRKARPRCKVMVNSFGALNQNVRKRCTLEPSHKGRHRP